MELIEIYRTWNERKAEQMKSLLEDYNITCNLSSHLTRSVMPFAGQQEVRVMVPEAREEEARRILKDFFELQPGNESGEKDELS